MDGREKQVYVNEIKYQIKMLNNLKGWFGNWRVIFSEQWWMFWSGGRKRE